MLSKYLYIPPTLGAMAFLLYAVTHDGDYAMYAVPCVVAVAVVFMLSPQIDWWWYKRHPLDLPHMLQLFINKNSLFYQNLGVEDKFRFRNRMAMYMQAVEFMPQGMEQVSPDVKGVVAACAVQMTFGQKDYLPGKFEHIVVYKHPFPSPQYPEHWHASEHFEEDGVIMFSTEQLMPGFLQPQRFFNIGLYEYARVFRTNNPDIAFPQVGEEHWPALEYISRFPKDKNIQYIGLPQIDLVALAVSHFFVFPENFKATLPDIYEGLARALNLRP